jgi:two-component system, NarL family, sensor kinase
MTSQTEYVKVILFILVFLAVVFGIIVLFITKSRKKLFEKELEKKDLTISYQKEILLTAIRTQEQERKRIAQDLHDDISSQLNVISLNLHALKSAKKAETEKLEIVDNTLVINNKAIETARKIAHNLLPPVLEKFGLHTALEELVLDFENTKAIQISYQNLADFTAATTEQQLHIFRIIQELISNSIKHGKASQVNIVFAKNECTYTDNGLGLDTTKPEKSMGLGMQNIASRIAFLNGKYSITSSQSAGYSFTFNYKI